MDLLILECEENSRSHMAWHPPFQFFGCPYCPTNNTFSRTLNSFYQSTCSESCDYSNINGFIFPLDRCFERILEEKEFARFRGPRYKTSRSALPSCFRNASSLTLGLLKSSSSVREQRTVNRRGDTGAHNMGARPGEQAPISGRSEKRDECSRLSVRPQQIAAGSRFLALEKRFSLVTKLSPALPRERLVCPFPRAAEKTHHRLRGLNDTN